MTPELSAWLLPALSWGVTYLIHSTLLIGGLWVALKLFRVADHGTRETLWKTALVGGLLTSGLQAVWAPPITTNFVLNLRDTESTSCDGSEITSQVAGNDSVDPQLWITPPEIRQAIPRATSQKSNESAAIYELKIVEANGLELPPLFADSVELESTERAAETAPAGTGEADRAAPHLYWLGCGLILAVAAAIAWGLTQALWQSQLLRNRLANCVPVTDGLAFQLLTELRNQIPHCPDVQLLTSDEEPEPAALGVWNWTIILPERAERELNSAELRTLLAHELAHLVRGDAVWLSVSRLVCSCLAFQPLNHLARREWQKSAEFLSDAWAVNQTGTPLALARCLTEVAGWRHSPNTEAASLAATGRRSGLAARVETLLQDGSPTQRVERLSASRWTTSVCAAAVTLLALVAPKFSLESLDACASEVMQVADQSEQTNQTDPSDQAKSTPQPELAGPAAGDENSQLLISIERELRDLERELLEMAPLLDQHDVPDEVQRRIRRIRGSSATLFQTRRVILRMIDVEQVVEGPAAENRVSL